jgi:hypothetical protein
MDSGWECSDNNTFYKNDGHINNSYNYYKNYIKSIGAKYWYDTD